MISGWNTVAQQMFGYTAAEAIGQPITTIISPELHEEEMDILRRLRTGEQIVLLTGMKPERYSDNKYWRSAAG